MTTRQQQILDLYTRPTAVTSTGSHVRLLARHAVDAGYEIWTRIIPRRASPILLAILIAACCGAVQAQEERRVRQYEVSYLDSLGGTNSRGNSINDRSWIAGYSLLPGVATRHATLWRDGSILDLGTLGGPDKNSSVTWPVKNTRGIIAGISQTDRPEPNGERWSCATFFGNQSGYTCLGFVWEDGMMRPLPPLRGGHNSFATGANNKGQVVGWAENGVRDPTCVPPQVLQFRPVIWELRTDRIERLRLIRGDTSGAATAINNKGQVVGISGICDQAVGRYTARHAVLWDDGNVLDIGDLGAELWNTPMSINQHGDIVGFAGTDPNDVDGNFLQAFIWTRRRGIAPLDRLPGHTFNQANAINDRGQVVGTSCTADFDCLAFFWERGVMRNLNDLVAPGFDGVLINGQDINDRGEITGRAFDPATGQLRAYVAVPVSHSEAGTGKKADSTEARAKVVLPEEVRQTLRRQRGLGKADMAAR